MELDNNADYPVEIMFQDVLKYIGTEEIKNHGSLRGVLVLLDYNDDRMQYGEETEDPPNLVYASGLRIEEELVLLEKARIRITKAMIRFMMENPEAE